jgi:hypothetical protein
MLAVATVESCHVPVGEHPCSCGDSKANELLLPWRRFSGEADADSEAEVEAAIDNAVGVLRADAADAVVAAAVGEAAAPVV